MREWLRRAGVVGHALAIVGGWAGISWGIASVPVVAEHVGTPQAWAISAGLFLLSVAGWRHLSMLFGAGVYALWRKGRES